MKIYYVGNSATGYREEFYTLSEAKKAMKENNCTWSEIVKVYSNGDWVPCGECQWYDHHHLLCVIGGDVKPTERAKDCFVSTNQTNGDRIRQGGDDALIDFADGIRRRMCHYCVYSKDKSCVDKTGDCWEGVRAWLDAPAKEESEVDNG